MVYWIRKCARFLSLFTLIILFAVGIDPGDPFNVHEIVASLLRAIAAASVVWLIGFIIGDMLFKGIIEDIDYRSIDIYEGGLLQRIHDVREEYNPESYTDNVQE